MLSTAERVGMRHHIESVPPLPIGRRLQCKVSSGRERSGHVPASRIIWLGEYASVFDVQFNLLSHPYLRSCVSAPLISTSVSSKVDSGRSGACSPWQMGAPESCSVSFTWSSWVGTASSRARLRVAIDSLSSGWRAMAGCNEADSSTVPGGSASVRAGVGTGNSSD